MTETLTRQLNELLDTFTPIGLKEMDGVKLLDRTDTKYVFAADELPAILNELCSYYRVLEVNGNRISHYETLYFDTPGFHLYFCHHNGHLNRFKVRYRKYLDSDLSFFEIKLKTNKNRTVKERIRQRDVFLTIHPDAEQLLIRKTNMDAALLKPALWVYYNRITLVGIDSPERLTIDTALSFINGERRCGLPALAIAEVKQDKSARSPFLRLMKLHRIRRNRISKYCIGMILVHPDLKKNNFKRKLQKINKICYEKD